MAVASEFALRLDPLTVAGTSVDCFRFEGGITNPSRTVLLIPGLASTGECFARQAPLAAMWDLRCLSLPASDRAATDAVRDYADLVTGLAARFDRPVLLGTSFGGLVAIDAVSRTPDLFSGIALISTFARWPASAWLRRTALTFSGAGGTLACLTGSFGVRFAAGRRLDAAANVELRREVRSITGHERQRRFRAALGADLRNEAAAIAVPALIVHGDEDPLVPVSAGRELAHLIRHSRSREIEGAAHLPYLTHPVLFNRIFDDFLWRVAWERELQSIA